VWSNAYSVSSEAAAMPQLPSPRPTVISITSGKGGVGKTLTSIHLAMNARRRGERVLLLDGDLGLSNVDVVLGLKARYNIKDVLDGHAALRDIILEGPHGVHIIPSGSGISSLTALSHVQKQILLDQTRDIEGAYDTIFIDTGAGISDCVMHFNRLADRVIVVTTPEPHAMTDAYAMIKVLHEQTDHPHIFLLINQARSRDESLKVFSRLSEVSQRFLQLKIFHLGHVPFDPDVPMRVLKRRVALSDVAHTLAGQAWAQVAQKISCAKDARHTSKHEQHDTWHRLLSGPSSLGLTASL
jgi:flagellar biosynthesis protein FlhG